MQPTAARRTVRHLALVGVLGGLLGLVGCSDVGEPEQPTSTSEEVTSDSGTEEATTDESTRDESTTPEPAEPTVPTVEVVDTLVTDVGIPWGIAFTSSGDALVSLRGTAEILRISPDGDVSVLGTVPGVASDTDEGGLLGLALAPGRDDVLFAYLTSATDNRVVRMSVSDDGLGAPEPIVTGIQRATNHNGGRLLFDSEGYLLISTGDAAIPDLSQDVTSLNGKILRVTQDGEPAPGNPFDNQVYSYGHRNVQGLAFDSAGDLWATEFGQDTTDELNLIEAGGNYGWPVVEGAGTDDRYIDPFTSWSPTSTASPSGLAIVDDVALIGALRGEAVFAVPLSGSAAGQTTPLLQGEFGRIRTIAQAPDGSIWVTTSNTAGWTDPRPGDDRVVRLMLG